MFLSCTALFSTVQASSLSQEDARTALGRRLFYDADLSADGSMSCATCHNQKHAFAESNATHMGVTNEEGIRNVPSLANIKDFTTLTWLEQHISRLEDQFFTPLMGHDPVEMGMTSKAVLEQRVASDACYQKLFKQAFPDESGHITADTIAQAVSAFERTLVSNTSAWDRAQKEHQPLSLRAQEGASLFFKEKKCAACHSGFLLSDQKFYKLTSASSTAVRTPSLRNVAVTAPYLHDGSAPTLEAALQAHHAITLTPRQSEALVAFMQTLTDQTFLHNPAFGLPAEECPL
ncbi:cytochrome C peroxidase [Acetobacter cibinongensis]|uniref:Cytochrome C peroxidase n=1 Tax=Acetobacter cibinongensis TaxID=146475 RepID=A0A1Z5YXY8_9PROT|nr:cytochrome C peroxidase [Acetobacter cibinongensis]